MTFKQIISLIAVLLPLGLMAQEEVAITPLLHQPWRFEVRAGLGGGLTTDKTITTSSLFETGFYYAFKGNKTDLGVGLSVVSMPNQPYRGHMRPWLELRRRGSLIGSSQWQLAWATGMNIPALGQHATSAEPGIMVYPSVGMRFKTSKRATNQALSFDLGYAYSTTRYVFGNESNWGGVYEQFHQYRRLMARVGFCF
jgi:hypothetical protein